MSNEIFADFTDVMTAEQLGILPATLLYDLQNGKTA